MTTYKYFKHLVFRETPYAPLKGRNPITPEMAHQENHYKLTYNKNNQLVRLVYKFGEQVVSPKRAGMMDGSYEIAPATDISYEGNLELRHFFDEQGNPSTNAMNIHKAVYEYNDKGKRISLKYYDKIDKPCNNIWGIFEYYWEAIEENKVLEKRKNISGQYVPMRPYYLFINVIYEYDLNGMLASMTNVDDKGNLVEEKTGTAIDKPVYDEKFQMTSFKFFNAKGENVIGSFLDSAGGEIVYDEKGNTIKYVTTNLKGMPHPGSKNWASTQTKYDEFGNMIEQSFFNEGGMPATEIHPSIEKPFTKVEFIYNKENIALKPEKVFHD